MLRYTYTLPLILIAIVFIADLHAPQDIEVHVLYLAAIALATKARRYSLMLIVIFCSTLIMLSAFINNITNPASIINRALTLFALATTGWLGDQITTALQASKEDQLTQLYNRRGIEFEKRLRIDHTYCGYSR